MRTRVVATRVVEGATAVTPAIFWPVTGEHRSSGHMHCPSEDKGDPREIGSDCGGAAAVVHVCGQRWLDCFASLSWLCSLAFLTCVFLSSLFCTHPRCDDQSKTHGMLACQPLPDNRNAPRHHFIGVCTEPCYPGRDLSLIIAIGAECHTLEAFNLPCDWTNHDQ